MITRPAVARLRKEGPEGSDQKDERKRYYRASCDR